MAHDGESGRRRQRRDFPNCDYQAVMAREPADVGHELRLVDDPARMDVVGHDGSSDDARVDDFLSRPAGTLGDMRRKEK